MRRKGLRATGRSLITGMYAFFTVKARLSAENAGAEAFTEVFAMQAKSRFLGLDYCDNFFARDTFH